MLKKYTFLAVAAAMVMAPAAQAQVVLPPNNATYVTPVGATTELGLDSSFVSQDGRFRLTYQQDGNLVLYEGSAVLWASNTAIKNQPGLSAPDWKAPVKTSFQNDGNLVVYQCYLNHCDYNNPLAPWTSSTDGHPGSTLTVQNDGNVVIKNPQGKVIWATDTYGH